MKIQIIGTGCPKCNMLTQNVQTAVRELGITCEIEKVTDMNRILSFGVMMTPALAIDGKVLVMGVVPSSEDIKKLYHTLGF